MTINNPSYDELIEGIESMALQFASDSWKDGTAAITTGGLSDLEWAFRILGWEDPHILPKEFLCQWQSCSRRSTCGAPYNGIYYRLCDEHYRQANHIGENT